MIQLPLTYKEFETFGCYASDSNVFEPTDMIEVGDYESYFHIVKGDAEVTFTVKNFSDVDQKLEDCDITELSISITYASRVGREVSLPVGLKVSDGDNSILMYTVRDLYGESGSREVEATDSLIYEIDTY